ncbi:MAG: hypothetical protein Q8P15_00345 [Nanoarchaeota archaeon]|nr:hypothetical protein [Nanoarchaeota archaeon]
MAGLNQKLSEAEKKAKEIFESTTIRPIGNGFIGGYAIGAGMNFLELREETIDAYKQIFLEEGKDFTQGYVEGRKWRIGNILNKKYKAAQKALAEMNTTQ